MKAHAQEMERLDEGLSFLLLSDLTSPDAPEEGLAELESHRSPLGGARAGSGRSSSRLSRRMSGSAGDEGDPERLVGEW